MNDGTIFYEKQRFTQWWVWLILIGVNVVIIFGVIQQVLLGKQFGSKPASNAELVIVAVLSLLFLIVFYSFRLETIIQTDGISVRFFPFHLKFKQYKWSEINKAYVRHYSPLKEFGGWGVRFGNKSNALNMSGNQGLQLEFNERKSLLIGTRKPDEVGTALHKVFQPA